MFKRETDFRCVRRYVWFPFIFFNILVIQFGEAWEFHIPNILFLLF
jgi:hypothetical protein